MAHLNLVAFHWINGWSNGYAPFYDFLSEATKWTWMRLILVVLVIWMIAAGPRSRRAALLSILGFLLANGVTDLFKNYLPMPRPCVQLPELGQTVIYHGVGFLGSYGTASAHAANTAVIAVIITYFLRRWGAIPIFISFFTGISRVYAGVHYPYQVLLGWACGLVIGSVIILTWRAYEEASAPSLRGVEREPGTEPETPREPTSGYDL